MSSMCGTAVVTLLTLVAFVDELVVVYRSTTQFIKETKQPNTGRVPNHNRADFDYMTFLLPDYKQAALTSHMISQRRTVTVVLHASTLPSIRFELVSHPSVPGCSSCPYL